MVNLGQLERPDAEQRLLSIGVDWEGRRCTWHNVKTGHGWRCEREVPGALLTVQLKDRRYDREAKRSIEVWSSGLDLDGTWATIGEYPDEGSAKAAADAAAPA